MIQRDVLMRQIRQLGQALAEIVTAGQTGRPNAVLEQIDEAVRIHLDGTAADLRTLPPETLLAMCEDGDRFVPEAAQTLARLLNVQGQAHREREEREEAGACFGRALLLYRRLLQDPAAPVSWKVGTTVAALSDRVDALPVDDATREALDALRNGTN
jgi:phosphoenolpyruvate carboxylase